MEKLLAQCKNCGGQLRFDPQKQTLSCEYCETSYHLPKAKVNSVLVRGYSNAFHPNQLNQNLNFYKCSRCGHAYFCANEEKLLECKECGSASLEKIKSSGYCADGIIPFEISKEQAAEKLVSFLKSKPSIPKDIIPKAKVENLTGVFVPVWNFIFDIDANFSANAAELKKDANGTYYTIPIPVYGTKSEAIKSADQCATTNQEDDLLELFDENDYDKIIPYTTEYTFGYKVDDINRNIHEYYEAVTQGEEEKLKREISNMILKKHKDVSNMQIETESHDVYFNFAYVPVYVYKYIHKGKTYKIYISGTTGKVAGKTPFTFRGVIKTLIKILGLAAVIAVVYYFMTK